LKLSFHLSSPPEFIDSSLKDHFGYFGEGENSRAHSAQNDKDGEYLALWGEFFDFLKANSKDSDDGHVEAVKE
jgi:hypothetical protein